MINTTLPAISITHAKCKHYHSRIVMRDAYSLATKAILWVKVIFLLGKTIIKNEAPYFRGKRQIYHSRKVKFIQHMDTVAHLERHGHNKKNYQFCHFRECCGHVAAMSSWQMFILIQTYDRQRLFSIYNYFHWYKISKG